MAREFKLPDIGEGVHEGEVVKWFVKEGDPIRENDPVVEVMTDKVTVQIPSPVTGKVLQLRAKEGEVVKVGATLVVFGEDGEAPPATPSAPAARPTSSAPPPAPSRTSAPPPPPPSSGEALAAPPLRRLKRSDPRFPKPHHPGPAAARSASRSTASASGSSRRWQSRT